MDIAGGAAKLKYLDGRFEWIEHGGYVVCAVTGQRIDIHNLRYWSVDHQEPYVSAEAASQRMGTTRK